jgi:hypothetical protein
MIAAVIAWAGVAQAAGLDVRGLAPGAHVTARQVEQALPGVRCHVPDAYGQSCAGATELAGKIVWADVHLDGGEVRKIAVTFGASLYDDIAAACRQKFGPPAASGGQALQNALGDTIDNDLATWSAPDGSRAILSRHDYSDVTQGLLLIESATEQREQAAERAKQRGEL